MSSFHAAIPALILALSGCMGQQVVVPKEVKVPVPVACIDALPPAPQVASDAELLAMDDFDLVLRLALDRKRLEASYGELRALAGACVR